MRPHKVTGLPGCLSIRQLLHSEPAVNLPAAAAATHAAADPADMRTVNMHVDIRHATLRTAGRSSVSIWLKIKHVRFKIKM